ncbi:hypothetical protein IGI04_017625 [Brassica rapa subsp. trilocularis]|uniref:Uncharacterized protein n=1 Tax=Brassica rapa subsp. trilocularis TaxID=1813537 RepID=A0ABQ7ME88_BRACM|nr:hypothetical protein IGI04_017625 [Brassica rapa subsp. trilocularis]
MLNKFFGMFALSNLMYEKQEDNIDTFQDKLLGPIEHDYKSDGLTTEIEVFTYYRRTLKM